MQIIIQIIMLQHQLMYWLFMKILNTLQSYNKIILIFTIFYMDQKINNILPLKNFYNQNSLQQESHFNNQIRQQIILQKFTSKKIQKQLSVHLQKVEEQGIVLANQLQIEMEKNKRLIQLVEDLKYRIEQSKRNNSQKLRNNMQNIDDELPSLQKRSKKIQYDLEQFIQKHNQTVCQINKTIEIVNSARSERVVYSGVFKNIQKQLFDAEIQYKKLLIEKVYCQNRLNQQNLLFKRIVEESTKTSEKSIQTQEHAPILKVKLFDDKFEKSEVKVSHTQSLNAYNTNDKSNESLKQSIIKRLLIDLQSRNVQQLINNLYSNEDNHELYNELVILEEKIGQVDSKLKQTKKKKQILQVIQNSHSNANQNIKNLKKQKKQFSKKIKQEQDRLKQFIQSTQKLQNILQISNFQNDKNECIQYVQILDQKLSKILPQTVNLSHEPRQINKQTIMKLNQMMTKVDKITNPMKLLSEYDIIRHCEQELRKHKK